jgi:glycerol kinase
MGKKIDYVLEGNINYTGAVIKWLVDDLGLIASSKEAGALAASVDSAQGVHLIPAFSGLGAPYFNDRVRAAITGMSRGTKKAHIVRAAEECIAYQIKDVVESINAVTPQPLSLLRVDGGPTRDAFLMQFQADMLGIDLEISGIEELSGAGAAYCAAIGAGLSTAERLFAANNMRRIRPVMDRTTAQRLYQAWIDAVKMINC